MLPTTAAAAEVDSGTCGDNLTWILDDAGTLTISGTEAMADYDASSSVPWYDNSGGYREAESVFVPETHFVLAASTGGAVSKVERVEGVDFGLMELYASGGRQRCRPPFC